MRGRPSFLWIGLIALASLRPAGGGVEGGSQSYGRGLGAAAAGDWARAAEHFRAVAGSQAEGGELRIDSENRYAAAFPRLGRGCALRELAEEAQAPNRPPELKTRGACLDAAISELGASLVESPCVPALWKLADAYLATDGSHEESLQALFSGGDFGFPDAEWRGRVRGLKPGAHGKVSKGGLELVFDYQAAGQPVRARLTRPLADWTAAELAKLPAGDLNVLGRAKDLLGKPGGTSRKSTLETDRVAAVWLPFREIAEVTPRFTLAGAPVPADLPPYAVLEVGLPAKVQAGAWSLTARPVGAGDAEVLAAGIGGKPACAWDTLARPVAPQCTLELAFEYRRGSSAPIRRTVTGPRVRLPRGDE